MTQFGVDQEFVQRFAGSLLHFLWQGAAVAVIAAISLRLLAGRSAELRYAVSITALMIMIAAPVFTFVFYTQTGAVALMLLQWTGQMLSTAGPTYSLATATAVWTRWILVAWCAGVAACTVRLLAGWHLSRRLVRSSNSPVPDAVSRMFERIRRYLALQRPIRLLINAHIDTPMVVGWIRPAVLLPLSALTGLSQDQLLAILAHELAHIRRHDFLVNILQRCVESILFYHPGVWWLSSRIRAERENCCDDLAVEICGDRRLYVRALVELERKRLTVPALAVAATDGSLVQRSQRILGLQTASADWQSAAATLVFVAAWMFAGVWQSNTLEALPLAPPRFAAPLLAVPVGEAAPSYANALNALAAIVTAQPTPPEESLLTGTAALADEVGIIQGVVTRAGTQEPIPDAQITIAGTVDNPRAFGALMSALAPYGIQRNPNPQRTEEGLIQGLNNVALNRGVPLLDLDYLAALKDYRAATAQFTATSDNTGRFTIKDVPPGRYTIRAERESYFGSPSAGTSQPLAVATVAVSKQATANVAVSMSSGATLGGRVRDAFNQPLTNALVEAFSISYQGGFPVLQAAAAHTTDDRGEFRLFWLPAGEYYVSVRSQSSPFAQSARTYYPGTPDVIKAIPVRLKPGDDVEGINYAARNVRPVTLSGVVNSAVPGNGGIDAVIMLMLRDDSIPDNTGERVAARTLLTPTSGRFEISGVTPGSYDLYARVPDSNPDRVLNGNGMTFGRVSVEVLNEDVSGIQVSISPTVAVRGSVTSDTGPTAWSNARFSVQVEGSAAKIPFFQTGVANRKVSAGPDGSFTLPAVPQGHYRVAADGLPKGTYVADVRRGGISVFDAGFDVGAEPPPAIQVILSSAAATVQGVVEDSAGKPVSGATVVLIPPQHRRQNWMSYRTATSDSSGRFTIQDAAPGDYKLFAWESVSAGAYYNPRFLAVYEGRGRAVRVAQSSAVTARVTANTDDGR